MSLFSLNNLNISLNLSIRRPAMLLKKCQYETKVSFGSLATSKTLIITNTGSSFHSHELSSTPAWISNYIHTNTRDQIIYPFPNFIGSAVENWKCTRNCIPHFTGYVIIYPCHVRIKINPCLSQGPILLTIASTSIKIRAWIRHKTGIQISFDVLNSTAVY